MRPDSLKVPLYKRNYQGLCLQKRRPNPALTLPLTKTGFSFCVYGNGRLRRRKRLFGLKQTVAS